MPGANTGRKSRSCGIQAGSARGAVKDKGVQVGTYPDVTQKAQAVMEQCKKQGFPQIHKCNGEVYLFMRGKREQIQTLKNAFVRDKKIVENFGGSFVGIAEEVTRCECDLYRGMPQQCIVVILFKDMDHAERWTLSSRAFKQKDFPSPADEMEIFAVPVCYLPGEDVRAFQLTEMHGMCTSTDDFHRNYVDQASKLLNKERIYHGVVATYNVKRLRNCMVRPDTFILLHQADSEDTLRRYYDSASYQSLKEYRHQTVAENDSCIFTINPLM